MTPYQYTYQNPINYIDPTGMEGEDPGDGGFWRSLGNLFKSKARINAEDKARSLANDPTVKQGSIGVVKRDQSINIWRAYYEELNAEHTSHMLDYSNDGLYFHATFPGINYESDEDSFSGGGSPSAGSISSPAIGTYFDRWDHQVAMGVLQGGSQEMIGYGIGQVLKPVSKLVTTSDGFLFGGVNIKSPVNIPVQRFGNMKVNGGDFWGLKIGSGELQNRMFAAIKTEWNPLTQYTQGIIPKGTPIKVGIIGPQGGMYTGGSLQFITESKSVINQATKIVK